MSLTDHQQKAFDEIKDFVKGDKYIHVLKGAGGVGKTFLTKYIANWAQNRNMMVAGLAPTHKARKVLDANLNKTSFLKSPTMTVASFLYKMKQHSYVGSKNFRGNGSSRASQSDLFLIDECSMICDKDVDEIVKHIKANKKKALFIGDPAQIPNPVQRYVKNEDGTISKKDSKSFDFPTSCLSEVIRQSKENPLLDIYTEIRKDLFADAKINRENNVVDGEGVKFYQDSERFLKKVKRDFMKINDDPLNFLKYKIITYTNDSVRNYNKYIRNLLDYEETFVVGDILMGYNNVGFPTPIIENGEEYFVKSVTYIRNHPIKYYKDNFSCSGNLVSLKIANTDHVVEVFFPSITSSENNALLYKLKELANKLNMKNSTKEDFKRYSHLKNQILFMENVYEYNGKVCSETDLKDQHPKLFNSVSYYIDSSQTENKLTIRDSKSSRKMQERYPGVLEYRVSDSKPLTDSERLVDRYQLIEKDIDYGYCCTAHKAQGSTYERVYIDEINFRKVGDKWNSFYNAQENGTKERNQLKYVAYTRPTKMAAVLYSDG